eukprot:COSAG02_NODE_593_length_19851_cov_13.232736_1_plen_354_part_00
MSTAARARLRHMVSVLGTSKQGDHLSSSGAAGAGTAAAALDPALVLRDLQKSPLRIADLMLGCAFNTVSDNRDGLMAAAEQDAIAAVAAAVELGIHEMDVSAAYGQGRSEEYVGSGLIAAGVPSGPSWINVWSKGGPELIRQKDDPTQTVGRGYEGERVNLRDFSAAGARAAFAESTARLGLERLAGFRIHDPSVEDVDTALGPDGFVAGLVAMRNEGLIGEVSLGELIVLFSLQLCVPLNRLALLSQRRHEFQSTGSCARHHALPHGGPRRHVQLVSARGRLEPSKSGLVSNNGRGGAAWGGDSQCRNLQHGPVGRRCHLCVRSRTCALPWHSHPTIRRHHRESKPCEALCE